MSRFLSLAGLLFCSTMSFAGGEPLPPIGGAPGPELPDAYRQPPGTVTLPATGIPTGEQWLQQQKKPKSAPALTDPALQGLQSSTIRLQAAREALAADNANQNTNTATEDAQEVARLRARMAELLIKLEKKRAQEATPQTVPLVRTPAQPAAKPIAPDRTTPAIASQHRAEEEFRSGRYDAALATLRSLDSDSLGEEDRLFVQYLTAGCLCKLGQIDEAAALYSLVAGSQGDETLVESSRWQLEAMTTRQTMTRELKDAKLRRLGRENP